MTIRPTLFLPERGRREGLPAPPVRGVVFDVHVGPGTDTLAAYADGTARCLNHGGAVIIWEARHPDIEARIDRILALAPPFIAGARPSAYGVEIPVPGEGAWITLLGEDALHVAQLGNDPASSELLAAGAELMQALIETDLSSRQGPIST